LLALVGGGLVFGTAYCVYGFFYYKKKVKDIWEDVKGPFRKGKDAWRSRKERRKMERKEKEQNQKLVEEKAHDEWLDTLPLTDLERKVAESEVVMMGW
jgi:transketolase